MDLRASIMAATKQAMKDKAANRLSTLDDTPTQRKRQNL